MGLFDLFSNDTAEEAARQRNQGLQQGYDTLSSTYGQGRDAIASTYGQGRDAITAGANTAQGYYAPLLAKYGAGSNAYGDASGANGIEGLKRGTEAFKNSGQYGVYGVGLGEGLQALQRTHAAAGNLNSGNADADTMKYATDQATKAYGSYLSGLQPYLGGEAGAASGAAGAATGAAGALDASYRGQGGAANASYMGQGGAGNANYTGQGASNAAATMNNYNVGANQLGALTSLAGLAAGGAGGLGGLTGGFGGTGFALGPTSVGGAPTSGGLFSMFQ